MFWIITTLSVVGLVSAGLRLGSLVIWHAQQQCDEAVFLWPVSEASEQPSSQRAA